MSVDQGELVKELQKLEWLSAPLSDSKPVHQRAISGENNYYYIFRKWEIAGKVLKKGYSYVWVDSPVESTRAVGENT